MPDFDVEAFVIELDRMGVKLTAIPLADGKLRVNRWCMLNATEHAQKIEALWTAQIGDDPERIDALAAHLAKAPRRAVDCISSGQLRNGSQSTAVSSAALDRPRPASSPNASGSNGEAGLQRVAGASSRRNS